MSKICKIGTKQAILNNLKKNKVIASDGKILKRDALDQMHFVYKDYLTQKFGISRNLILTNAKHTYIQFDMPSIEEVDALYGLYYPENERFRTNIIDNKTLTPIELANKYIKITNKGEVVLNSRNVLLEQEDAQKFKIGLSEIFPEYTVEFANKNNIAGESLYAINLKKRPDIDVSVMSRRIDGAPQTEVDQYTQMDVVQKSIEPLLKKFKNVRTHWISAEEIPYVLASTGKPVAMKNGVINALAIGRDVFLVKGRVTPKTAIEEFMHIFVDTLAIERPALYEGLKNKAMMSRSDLFEQISDLYPEELFGKDYIEKELVTQSLRDAYMAEREERPQGVELNEFLKLADRFFKWMLEKLNQVFDMAFDKPRAEISELPLDMTLEDVALFLNVNDVEIPHLETTDTRYSITADENTDDSLIESELKEDLTKLSAEEIAKLKKDKKLEKAINQIKKLTTLKKRYGAKEGTGKIVETLDKLISITENYISVLESDVATVSVTNFIGSPNFTEQNQKANKKFQDFGTFIHNFMEELQDHVLFAKKEKVTPIELFSDYSYEFFFDYFEKNKQMLSIKGLDAESFAKEMLNLVAIVSGEAALGNLIIPELTITGKDSLGRDIVGRIDYLVIKPDGTVSTRDFKTNKVNRSLKFYNDTHLHNTLSTKLKLNPDVHPAFEIFPGRSKVGTYLSQVGVYRRLFAQNGIKSVDDAIINIMYGKDLDASDEDTFVYDRSFVKMLSIEGENGLKYKRDENGVPTTELTPVYERIITALNRSIPVEGEENILDTKAKAIQDIKYIENLNEDSIKRLVANLKNKIQSQLDSIGDEIQKASAQNADENVINKLKERRTTLFEIQAQFDSTYKTEEGFKQIADQVILKASLDKVIELATTINKECKQIASNENQKFKINALKVRFDQINDLKNFLDTFNSILLENGVPETSDLIKEISEGITQCNAAKSEYIKVAEEKFIEVLLKVPKSTAEGMMKDYKAMIGPKLRQLERIVNGDASVFEKGVTFWLSSIKKLVGKTLGQTTITDSMKVAAQSEINRINNFIKYEKFDREFVKLYVENTFNNPEHGFYIGSTITTGFGGLSMDDLRSSFGNSELALTATANFMVNQTINAKIRFNQLMQDLKIDTYIKKAEAAAGSYNELNRLLSERVSILGSDGKMKEFMKFIGPISQKYFNTYDQFDYEIQQLNKQIDEAIKQNATTDAEKASKKDNLKQLSDLKQKKLKEFKLWLVENAETKLKAEVYLLEVQLPEDIQQKIKNLNDEITSLRGTNEDFELSNATFDRIQELELDIEKAKKEALERDPSLKNVYDQYEKYYTYDINWDRFNYTKNKMIKKYGEESDEYKTWLELNAESIPMEDWYEETQALREKIDSYYMSNGVLVDLYEQRRELINKYKFKSKFSVNKVFNPAYMSDSDAELLDNLEYSIEKEQEKGNKNTLSQKEYKEVQELRNKYNNLRQTVNKPSFTRSLENKIKELLELYTEAESTTNEKQKATLQTQYKTREEAFKQWYERNNNATYKLGTIASRGSVNAVPKSFNTIAIPTDPSRMIMMPTSKYKTRYYKEEAYNPNYKGTLEKRRFGSGEYALPKGISYENGRWVVSPGSTWYNEGFNRILKNQQLLDVYNTLVMDLYYNKQQNINAKKLGLFFPGVLQNAYDSIATDGVQGLKRELNESINDFKLKNSIIDEARNTYGIAGQNRVTFSHNYMLGADLVTKDGVNAIIQWAQQYEINQSMEEANLWVSPAIDFLKNGMSQINDPLQKKQVQKVIDIMEYERNKLIFGQSTTRSTNVGKVSGNKLMKMFLSAVSWGRLAFDPAMQVGNLVSGNVQTFLATQMKGAGVSGTIEDYLWAKGQLYGRDGFMYQLIGDWGGLSDLSLATKIYRFLDPTFRSLETLDITSKSKMQRLLRRGMDIKDLAFIIQDKGEMEIALTTMLKTLKANKFYMYETDSTGKVVLDADGNKVLKTDGQGNYVQISAYEALINNQNSVVPGIREDVAMTEDDLLGIRAMIQQEYMRHQGNYSSMTKSPIEGSMLGQLLMFFRKYLVPAVEVRFKGMFDSGDPRNWVAGEAQLGWWTGFFKIFQYYGGKEGLKELILPNFLNKNSSVDLYYRNKMFQVKKDVLAAVAFAMAYAMARGLIYASGDDDDDKELTWAQMQSLRVLVKVANETRSLTPLPHFGKMDDYITNFSTFTTAFSEGKNLVNLVENMGYYTAYNVFDSEYAYDLGYYQKRSGRYEKGDPKFYKGLAKLTGIENIQDIFDPQYALKQQYQSKK